MTCLPRFILTAIAIVFLAFVVFGVPYIRTVYFLKAAVKDQGAEGSITFGTLGYCVRQSTNTTCSKPSLGYRLDINGLVGNTLPVKIPSSIVQLLTLPLVLHVVALITASVSASLAVISVAIPVPFIFGILCSISSWVAFLFTLGAFAFDVAFFFIAKARINAVGHASIGPAIWLTLTACILLLLGGIL